jgi:hypothetical protein
MRTLLLMSVLVLSAKLSVGCASRVILVHPSKDVMKLAEPVKAKVFVYQGGQWVRGQNRVTLPAGYTVLYMEPK